MGGGERCRLRDAGALGHTMVWWDIAQWSGILELGANTAALVLGGRFHAVAGMRAQICTFIAAAKAPRRGG